jgi:hypothetical protein
LDTELARETSPAQWTDQNIGPDLIKFSGLEHQKDGLQRKKTVAQVTSIEVFANYLQEQ